MLLQSRIDESQISDLKSEITLLPALPAAWPEGAVTGLRARGGFEVDLAWKDGHLTAAAIRSTGGTGAKVRLGLNAVDLSLRPGEGVRLDAALRPQ